MWFNKLSLKAAALVLAGMASSAFAQALAPLQITADDWNYLSNFKLFGQKGLSFGNQDEFPNEAGWVGTADGDLYSASGKNNGVVGGAIIVGGTIHPHSNMRFTTGPIRYGTGFTSGVYNGSVRCDGLTTSGSCKDVPLYRKNLVVPSAGTISGITQSVPDRQELKIEMPYKGSYDVYFSSLSLGAEAALIIELPDKKHAARLFINQLNVDNHPMFLVKYKNENGYRCIAPNNKFQLSGKDAECVGDYEGNLVVYVNHDIKFKNTDNYPMDGTFIFNGTAEFVSNFMFSGQIFAKELKLGDDINGKNFKFVKVVDPPKIILSQRSATFKESNSWYEIGIGLDSDQGEKDVTFDYCFEFQGSDIPGKFAIPADVDVSGTGHDFPICGKATGHVTIPKGKTVAQTEANKIFIKPLIDGFVEESSDGEKLWLKVSNVQGAEVSSVNYDASHGFNVFITDVDKIPSVSSSLVINVNEDESHTFTKAEFKFEHNVVDRPKEDFKSVIITGLPSAGSLTLNGTAVTRDQEIAVGSLGKLVYTPKANEFGNNYATFKYKVVRTGAGDDASVQSAEYPATVNVIPVNDKPTVADVVFTVNELDHAVSGGPISVSDVSINKGKELGVDEYNYDLVNVSGSDFAAFKNVFEIVPSNKGANATIKVIGALDYSVKKQYVVYATVTDNAATETTKIAGKLTSNQFKITVKIQNENDAPTIGDQTFTIAEKKDDGSNWPYGTPVGKVTTASDPDDDPLTYSVVTTGVPFKFNNGSNELVITDGSVLDFETKPTWTFKVQVTDPSGDYATASITVKLTDVNEPIGDFVLKEYSVKENTDEHPAVTSIGSFEVFDPDAGDVLSYSITGALTGAADATTASKNLSDIFVLKETKNTNGTRTVSINVKNAALLDYEKLYSSSKNTKYQATVTITDQASHKVSKTTTIAIQDVNEKVSAKGGTFYLNEHYPAGSPLCATAYKDADDKPIECAEYARVEGSDIDLYTDSFKKLTYTMSANNTGTMLNDSKKFTVNPNDGSLSSNADNFDYETGVTKFKFLVTVSDGEFSADAEVTVLIDDIKEPEINLDTKGSAIVWENTSPGKEIDDFAAIEDEAVRAELDKIVGSISYDIDQTASANAQGLFEIDDQMGIITVKPGVEIDFEAIYPSVEYTVKVVASGKNADGAPVKVNIDRKLIVRDANEKPAITGASQSTQNKLPSGVTKKDLEIYVPETWTSADDVFGKVDATDPDNAYGSLPHPYGFNVLTYRVEKINPVDGSTEFPFELNPNTGAFTVAAGKELNFTKQKKYECVVKVMDRSLDPESPSQSTTATIVINVLDENRPSEFKVLTNPYDVDENEKVGKVLNGEKIVVYDEDEADLDKLKITITDKDATAAIDAAKLFEVVQVGKTDSDRLSTFEIKTKAGIDYEALYKTSESEAIFNITLTIEDSKGNKTSQDTRILVNDVNEEPAFTKTSYEFAVRENIAKDSVLGKAEAHDPDIYNTAFGTLYFSLDGADAAPFDIGSDGEISVTKSAKLDYETKKKYVFKAVVTDKKFTKEVTVTVNILDVDETPVFKTVPELAVDENTKEGITVGSVVAEDDDCKSGNTCKKPTYTLAATDTDADDYKAFTVDKTSGTVKVAKDSILNYEVQKEYSVRVVATDGDDPTLSTFVDVTIKINDVNDAPTYEEKEYVFEIHEKATVGEFVGSVVAEDEDTWSKLTYALSDYETGSKDSEAFTIEDGKIYLKSSSLNYETKNQYQVWAKATDNGDSKGFPNYTATTLVTINLIDDPDEPKIIDDGKKGYDVEENTDDNNTPNGKEIACYLVKDEDKGQLATLVPYVTDVGNTNADRIFDAKMKKDSLCLIVKDASKLNYETNTHTHVINVAVMDADRLTAKVEKTINIVDVNEMPIIMGSKSFTLYENKGEGYVVGKLYPDDIDTSKAFIDNVFTPVGGDTDLFTITEDGKIKAKRDFDYEKETVRTFELDVALSDRNKTKYPKLTTKTTITITLKDMPEVPEITTKEFSVYENSPADSLIGIIKASDPDGDTEFLFSLTESSPYVVVKPNGEIRVKEGATIDYEKMQKFTIKVTVKDSDGLEFDDDIVIKVIDVNEPPTIKPQEFTFPEDSKPGTKKGPVEATDPDTKNPKFNDLKFYPVEENEKFEIKPNGDIVLKSELDYEKEKSYVIKVFVTDGEFKDTTEIAIKVGNVIEKSDVVITRVEAGDSVYLKPKKDVPIKTNQPVITVEWKQDGKTMSSLDTLKEGCQLIIKSYKAPSKDVAGADTIEVCYSTAAPVVDIDATKTKVIAENIYTIVESVDKKDSSIYVNNKSKEVQVTVKDTVSKTDTTFSVVVVLDTIAISNKTVKEMVDISKTEIALEKNPKTETSTKPIGDKKKVSYDKVVKGDTVTVSYYVDNKGQIIKTPVVGEDGKKKMTEVIEVSTVVDVKGKKVTVSYKADAETGKILYGDSEGNLMVDVPESSSDKKESKDKTDTEVDLKTGVGAFTVTYDVKGKEGNKTTVSYVVDEKGKIVANEEGDRGYLVTYTYTNDYGNSADKSVFMVLDKLAPIVKILTPSEGDVVFANFVDVDWCIAVDGDEKNCVKQDTLNFQSLTKGVNTIKRIYRDKAGNETVAEVNVMMKKAKDVNIDLEKPMVIVSIDSVNKYYESNPPEEDQRYAVSILNPKTQKEKEIVKGNVNETKKGSGDEPYPGYKGHIGPTVTIDMKLPIVSAVGGLATLDDIIINGDMVALDGVDADGSEKVSVNEYVKKYCSSEFQEELGKDYSKATLYNTTARVTLWFYTTGGQFVDKYQYNYEIDDPEYVDKAGLVKFFFEMKPDVHGELRDKHGRLYGTGPYIVKTKVDIRSQQRCVVPPVTENSKIGDVLKSSDEMLKRFGYRRPVLRGNERAATPAKKEEKKDTKKTDDKSKKK